MRIAYISADYSDYTDESGQHLPGGCGWYRCWLPGAALRAHGHEVEHFPNAACIQDTGEILGVDWEGQTHDGFGVVVIQRWMHPRAASVIKGGRKFGQLVVGDIDDWFEGLATTNGAYINTHPRLGVMNRQQARTTGTTQQYPYNVNSHREALAACSLVTVSTPYLAERYKKLNVPIAVIRNAIDIDRWTYQPPTEDNRLVGWVGATSHRSGDLETLKGVLGPFLDRNDLRFLHAGASVDNIPAYELLKVDPERMRVRRQVTIDAYPDLLAGIGIGVAPLRDIPFNHAKSSIKLFEYAASGIPFVASSTPEYEWFGQGWLAKRSSDWISGLNRMLDYKYRLETAEAARQRVLQEDIAVRWTEWETVYANGNT